LTGGHKYTDPKHHLHSVKKKTSTSTVRPTKLTHVGGEELDDDAFSSSRYTLASFKPFLKRMDAHRIDASSVEVEAVGIKACIIL
jgi:hypothetical protein